MSDTSPVQPSQIQPGQPIGLNVLTHSALSKLRLCPRQYYYRYELGLARTRTGTALRFGGAFHKGLEVHNLTRDPAAAIEAAVVGYDSVPDYADPFDWHVERETIRSMLAGHFWRYEQDDLEIVSAEQTFELPLVNPDTGASSRTFVVAGKIDAIVKMPDSRLAVLEYKTAGEDIGPNSDYWLRLRCDPQISMYVLAARSLGFDVATVLYDATRKPSIAPHRATPIESRRYTKDGRLYANQRETDEAPEEFGERLLADLGERPDFYFGRREVPRLDDELAEFSLELWQQAKQLMDSRRSSRWFRNVSRFTCNYCDYVDICLGGSRIVRTTAEDGVAPHAPGGFEFLADVHPELAANTGDVE